MACRGWLNRSRRLMTAPTWPDPVVPVHRVHQSSLWLPAIPVALLAAECGILSSVCLWCCRWGQTPQAVPSACTTHSPKCQGPCPSGTFLISGRQKAPKGCVASLASATMAPSVCGLCCLRQGLRPTERDMVRLRQGTRTVLEGCTGQHLDSPALSVPEDALRDPIMGDRSDAAWRLDLIRCRILVCVCPCLSVVVVFRVSGLGHGSDSAAGDRTRFQPSQVLSTRASSRRNQRY